MSRGLGEGWGDELRVRGGWGDEPRVRGGWGGEGRGMGGGRGTMFSSSALLD